MRRLWLLVTILALAGCNQATNSDVLPTLANPDAIGTAIVLTENAPPSGFDTVSFPSIDDNLRDLPGWRYEMFFSFDGVFARTPRETGASTQATVNYDQVGSAQRVQASIDVDLEDTSEAILFEGVRLGPDTFLVRDERCTSNTPEAELLADLSAGSILGGVQDAVSAVRREQINGEEVWLYQFLVEDMILPNVSITETGRILSMIGELWVAPEHNVVMRYNVTLEVENATIFDGTLPISGTISMQYNLFDIGVIPNISVPNGC